MSKKQKLVTAPGLPPALVPFFNPPPLLSTENSKDYSALLIANTEDIQPTTTRDWISVKEITDLDWEIRRERRMGVYVLEDAREVEPKQDSGVRRSLTLSEALALHRKIVDAEKIGQKLPPVPPKRNSMTYETVQKSNKDKTDWELGLQDAKAYRASIEPLAFNTKRTASLEARRAAAYRELAFHRECRSQHGWRRRVIDAEFSEPPLQLPAPPLVGDKVDSDRKERENDDLGTPDPGEQT